MAGLTVGALLGGALAVLMTPQSGQELRNQMRDQSLKVKEQVEEGAAQARTRADETVADVRRRAEIAQTRGREMVDDQVGKVKEAADKAKSTFASKP